MWGSVGCWARVPFKLAQSQTQHRLFVRVAPGLEPWLSAELSDLEAPGNIVEGGVELRASTEQLWRIHRECRLAESVRVRLRSFPARHFGELIDGLKRLPWHAYLNREQTLSIRVSCHRSRLWHSDAVAQRVRKALETFASNETAPTVGNEQTVFIRITGDIVQASVDASGDLLHRRGHRTYVGTAPLRETLAAAMVRMLDTKAASPPALWDPFCGSGSLPLEWLEYKLGLPAGRDRAFAFEQWPTHNVEGYRQWLGSRPTATPLPLVVLGSDIDPNATRIAESNATRCKFEQNCTWMTGDFESFVERVPLGSSILANPPYGIRLGGKEAYVRLLRRFEDMLARRSDLRPVVILVPMPTKPWEPALDWRTMGKFHNGGVPVQALRLSEPNA